MAYDRFLIAPFDESSGLITNARPWQIPDNSWARMDNAYVFRGRIKKRFGSRYMGSPNNPLTSRLRLQVGTTVAVTGNFVAADIRPAGSTAYIGGLFSVGTTVFTVWQPAGATLTTGTATATFTVATGFLAITGNNTNPLTPIYWYPARPVMGLDQYEFADINNFLSFGFDTQFAYVFTTSWALSNNSPVWHGSDTNFFWAYNWVGPNAAANALVRALFVTNFFVTNINGAGTAADDPVYYWNGTTWTAYKAYLNPGAGNAPATGPFIETALMIFPFHGRLLYLNTIENDGGAALGINTNYVNRVRYTSVGSPFAVAAWYGVGATDNAGNIGKTAGFEDASTLEAIISAEFIKDRLIVYFEESTWELTYTGNEQRPFEWQKLNTELGSMATFSTIAFDKAILTVGEVGIHSCNGSNVSRIDQKIPDEIFKISNPSSESQRICGIRDYFNELVYWSVPEQNQRTTQPYPTRVLVYNYQNQTWSFNDDAITTFGYWDGQPMLTWATIGGTWEEWSTPWNSGAEGKQVRQIIAGNQEGFTFIIDGESQNTTRNAGVLQITTMTQVINGIQLTIYNHMLKSGDYIYVEHTNGVVLNGSAIYQVIYSTPDIIVATYPESVVEVTGNSPTFTGTYTGGGTAARVSNYNLYSKQWNPYDKDGRNVYIAKIDFAVIKTPTGQVTVDYSASSTDLSSLAGGQAEGSIMGTGVLETSPYPANLYPQEAFQNRLWHPIYLQIDGECVQINIYMTEVQMSDPEISFKDFQIEAIILNTQAVSYRLQ